jgi:hypothetical protein
VENKRHRTDDPPGNKKADRKDQQQVALNGINVDVGQNVFAESFHTGELFQVVV